MVEGSVCLPLLNTPSGSLWPAGRLSRQLTTHQYPPSNPLACPGTHSLQQRVENAGPVSGQSWLLYTMSGSDYSVESDMAHCQNGRK